MYASRIPKCLGCVRVIYNHMTNVSKFGDITQLFYDGLRFCGVGAHIGHSGKNLSLPKFLHLHIWCLDLDDPKAELIKVFQPKHLYMASPCGFSYQNSFAPGGVSKEQTLQKDLVEAFYDSASKVTQLSLCHILLMKTVKFYLNQGEGPKYPTLDLKNIAELEVIF